MVAIPIEVELAHAAERPAVPQRAARGAAFRAAAAGVYAERARVGEGAIVGGAEEAGPHVESALVVAVDALGRARDARSLATGEVEVERWR